MCPISAVQNDGCPNIESLLNTGLCKSPVSSWDTNNSHYFIILFPLLVQSCSWRTYPRSPLSFWVLRDWSLWSASMWPPTFLLPVGFSQWWSSSGDWRAVGEQDWGIFVSSWFVSCCIEISLLQSTYVADHCCISCSYSSQVRGPPSPMFLQTWE